MSGARYKSEIARARTIGFAKDVDAMRARGLTLGGNMDNAIVFDERKLLNSDGLRYGDEVAKHKILDAIGDLYVAGNMLASYSSFRGGHALNNKLLRALLADQEAWEIVSFDDEREAPPGLVELAPAW